VALIGMAVMRNRLSGLLFALEASLGKGALIFTKVISPAVILRNGVDVLLGKACHLISEPVNGQQSKFKIGLREISAVDV